MSRLNKLVRSASISYWVKGEIVDFVIGPGKEEECARQHKIGHDTLNSDTVCTTYHRPSQQPGIHRDRAKVGRFPTRRNSQRG